MALKRINKEAPKPFPVEIDVDDDAADWESAGFTVSHDGRIHLGEITVQLCGRSKRGTGGGITGWTLGNLDPCVTNIDGIRTGSAGPMHRASTPPLTSPPHPNGVIAVDHLVLLTSDVERTVCALAALGLHPRRRTSTVRKGVTQVIYRPGHTILEVVGVSPDAHTLRNGPASAALWGLTLVTRDVSHTHAHLPHTTKPPWPAVQPGRHLTVLKAGVVSVALAFMSPHVHGAEGRGPDREKLFETRARTQERLLRDRKSRL